MRKTALFCVLVLLLFACGKKEVKQVSADSRITLEAFGVAETLRQAFVEKDENVIRQNTTEEGYGDVTANSRPYDKVDLSFTNRWVEIENNQLTLYVTWKSTWTSGGKTASDRGMAALVMEGRPLRVSKILRANPFVFPAQ